MAWKPVLAWLLAIIVAKGGQILSKRPVLHAIYDDDLKSLLESLGLLDSLMEGELMCHQCGEVITPSSLGLLRPTKRKVVFVCEKCSVNYLVEQRVR